MRIGKQIRNLGVCELARRTGKSPSHISRVIAGKRPAGRSLAARLSRLGVILPA